MNTAKDPTLDWMFRNLPSEEITLANYIAINWCGDKTLEDLEAEELAELPEIFEAELPQVTVKVLAPGYGVVHLGIPAVAETEAQ